VIILSKILIVVLVTALVRSSARFRDASREFDEHAMATLRQAMIVTESMGYPRLFAPFLIILTALFFMLAGMH
jgi:hypothetical protein